MIYIYWVCEVLAEREGHVERAWEHSVFERSSCSGNFNQEEKSPSASMGIFVPLP